MKILNFGSLNYDYTYMVSHMVSPGETLASSQLQIHCGGKGLNQSIALARAGIKVYHAGMVGEDGQQLIDTCSQEGIDVGYIRRLEGKSGHAIIQVNPEGENCILLYGGANRKNSEEQIDEVLDFFGEGDMLLLQNEINLVDVLIKRACERGMKIVLNPSPFENRLMGYGLEKVHTFLINETEGKQMSGEEDPGQMLKKIHQMYPDSEIVLTLGEKGVRHCDCEGNMIEVPAFQAAAVDTTAAGDTFTGYYLAGICNGISREKALCTACGASALAVMKKGAAESIPMREEVLSFLEKYEKTANLSC